MHLLHLVGATNTRFYHDLSCTYHASTVTPEGMTADTLRIVPDGRMFLRKQGATDEIATDLSTVAALAADCDLVVPFMFCPAGMTVWRDLFETIFGKPVVGPPLAANVISTSKLQTKAIARAAGVRTPQAQIVRSVEIVPEWTGACIVKPDAEDNSIGLSLVEDEKDLTPAIRTALEHGNTVLVEDYIAGREIRVGVLDAADGPQVLPALEYHVTREHPIRVRSDKVDVDATGAVTRRSWDVPSLETSCPAPLAPALADEVREMVLTMHRTLGARDYSLYDLRIEADTGTPYLLEACSFWTFAPMSILSRMVEADGRSLEAVTREVFTHAADRKRR